MLPKQAKMRTSGGWPSPDLGTAGYAKSTDKAAARSTAAPDISSTALSERRPSRGAEGRSRYYPIEELFAFFDAIEK
jgi:hypothetical protein